MSAPDLRAGPATIQSIARNMTHSGNIVTAGSRQKMNEAVNHSSVPAAGLVTPNNMKNTSSTNTRNPQMISGHAMGASL